MSDVLLDKLKDKGLGWMFKKTTYLFLVLIILFSVRSAYDMMVTEGKDALINKNIGIMLPFVIALYSLQITVITNNVQVLRNSEYNKRENRDLIDTIIICSIIGFLSIFSTIFSYFFYYGKNFYFIVYLADRAYISSIFLDPENIKLFIIDIHIIFSLMFLAYMIYVWLIVFLFRQRFEIEKEIGKEEINKIDSKEKFQKEDKDQSTADKENSTVNTKSETQKRKRKKAKKR